jgi:hypothetical protein
MVISPKERATGCATNPSGNSDRIRGEAAEARKVSHFEQTGVKRRVSEE